MSRILRRLAEVDEERKIHLRVVPTPTTSGEAFETGIVLAENPAPSPPPPTQVPSPKR